MSDTPQNEIESMMLDTELAEEIVSLAESPSSESDNQERTAAELVSSNMTPSGSEGFRYESAGNSDFAAEAIVLTRGRPTLLVQDGTFELPTSRTWRTLLEQHRTNIEEAIARVGRVELLGHPDFDWVGTGWIVAPGIVATNRHVAVEFARKTAAGSYEPKTNPFTGDAILSRIDLREEHEGDASFQVPVSEIIYIADDDGPDIALLKMEGDIALPDPLILAEGDIQRRQSIGVIGYPAHDSRNGQDAMTRYFGDIYNVKRFAPGRIMDIANSQHYFKHDCTTLGGNSGSSVIDLETGEVVGIHFAGRYRQGNYAVKNEHIKEALRQAGPTVVPVPPVSIPPIADGTLAPSHYEGRKGYEACFLGEGNVPLPRPGDQWEGDLAEVEAAEEDRAYEAKYCHFSVVVSKSRKQPLVTAVNIDGTQLRRLRRSGDKWYLDGRIAEEFQIGNEAYRGNDLDRGHMVRRLDPVWGDEEEAQLANDDTFHYVNSCPQHKDLNRQDWVRLEDEVLDHAAAKDQKLSIFTGPVMKDTDKWYTRGGDQIVKLPKEFWKVVALIDENTNQLSTAGFILSQGDMIREFTEVPFVPGRSAVYQVQVSLIEEHTGLEFGVLKEFDAFTEIANRETMPKQAVQIHSSRDLVFPRRTF